MNKNVFAELAESIKETGAIRQMNGNIQMVGNAALMALPKVAFLSSRRVAPAAVMRCYDWATGMRGGGRGATALPSGHAGRVTLPPDFAKCGGSRREVESAAKMAAIPVRVWTLPRWRLPQPESRRDVLFYAR